MKFNVAQGTYSGWEKESVPSLEVIISLADFFKVSVDDLLKKEFTRQNAPERWSAKGEGQAAKKTGRQEDDSLRQEVEQLQKDVQELRNLFIGGEGTEKVRILEVMEIIAGYLEEGLDESKYLEEKKAYLSKVKDLLGSGDH